MVSRRYRSFLQEAICARGKNHGLLPARCVVLGLVFWAAQPVQGAELRFHTLQAWRTYIRLTERRVAAELQDGQKFLAIDFLSDSAPQTIRSRLRNGEVDIRRMKTAAQDGKEISVSDGIIHHWVGGIWVPGVSLQTLLDWLQDYDQHQQYFEEIEESRLLHRAGPTFQVFYRLRRKKIVMVLYNTLHGIIYRRHGPRRASSHSFTTRIAELQDAGTPEEKEKPAGNDGGYLWRLNSYWRFQEADGGVFVECESVSLSRSIPFGLSWFIKGYVESIPRESLENTLTSLRDGVAASRASAPPANP